MSILSLEHEQIYLSASFRVFNEQLPHEVSWVNRYALGNLACAETMVEGPSSAMTMAHDRIAQFGLGPADSFGVWADLVKQGVSEALPQARRAVGIAGEDLTFLETIGAVQLHGLHSAERLVELVEAGDKDSIPLARGMAQNTWALDRTALLGKLYEAGDSKSLDLAIASAKEAKAYCDSTGDMHYHRSERALFDMGLHAARTKKPEDAELLAGQLKDSYSVGSVFAELCKEGFMQYTPKVVEIINTSDSPSTARGLIRGLAAAGYPQAIEILEQNSLPRRAPQINPNVDIGEDLRNLLVLHQKGVGKAATRVRELLDRVSNPQYYLSYLGAVGLKSEEVKMAEAIFARNPTHLSAQDVVYADFTIERWQRAFDLAMTDRPDAHLRSGDVKNLAHNLTA